MFELSSGCFSDYFPNPPLLVELIPCINHLNPIFWYFQLIRSHQNSHVLQAAISPCSLLQLQPFGWFLTWGVPQWSTSLIHSHPGREQWVGDGWGMLSKSSAKQDSDKKKYTPNSISFSYFSSQRITWLLSRIHYSSYYFCHFWVDCLTGNHWFPRGFPLVAHLSGSSAASAASARRSAASVRSWRQKGAPHGERQRSGPSCCSNSPGAPWFWAFGYTIMKKPWALGLFSRIWMFNWSKFFRVGSAY